MKKPILWALTFAVCAVAAIPSGAKAQNSSTVPPPITFSSIGFVPGVQLTGTATWQYGSDVQTGTATLKAFANGGSQMFLSLSRGPRVETQNPLTDDQRNCTWSGPDGVAHSVADHNCRLSTVWFLPHVTLQSGAAIPNDVVSSSVSSDGKTIMVEHKLQPTNIKNSQAAALLTAVSTVDVGVDAGTQLPQWLLFKAHPDNDAATNLQVEIDFSDYRTVNGITVPFHIQKHLNHALVLDLQVSDVQLLPASSAP